MSVFKRGDHWWIDWYDPGVKRRRKKIGPDKRIATAALRDIQVKISKGEYLGLKEETISFRAFSEKYWQAVQHTFSEQERDRASRILSQHLLPRFGTERLSRVSRQQIEAYLAQRAGQVKPGTVNKELIRLRHLLNRAVAWGYIKANPCQGVSPLKEPPPRVKYLVPEQVDRLLEACGRHSVGLWAITRFALSTAMRQGELLGLLWGDIDLEARNVTLRKTKNNDVRVVPLNREAREALQIMLRPGDPFTPCFPGWTRAKVSMAFHRACRRAAIGDFRFHDCRHHAASWLTMKGVNQRTIEAICGWKDPRTARRYQHLNMEALHEAVERLEGTREQQEVDTEAKAMLLQP